MKKTYKKILFLIFVLIVNSIFLVSCKNQQTNVDENVKELNVWLPPFGDNDKVVWEKIFKTFEDKHNVKINLEIIPWDGYPEKYAMAIGAGEGPDVGYMYAEMFPQFIEMGAVEDLTDKLSEKDLKEYIYIEHAKMMGGTYGIPVEAANPAVLFYNKDILDNLDETAPETWDDFIRISKKATLDLDGDGNIDQWGLAQGWGSPFFGDLNWNWYGYLWQAGGEIFNEDLKSVRFNDQAGLEAAQLLYDLNHIHKVVPSNTLSKNNNEMIQTVFGPGKAAFAIGLSSTAASTFDTDFPELNWGHVTSLKNKNMGTFASVDQLTLMSSAKDKELAFELMKYMVSPESMKIFHEYHPRAPITATEPFQGDPRFKETIENDNGIYRPLMVGPHGVEIYEYLWKQLQRMISNEISPKEALDEAAKYANELLSK